MIIFICGLIFMLGYFIYTYNNYGIDFEAILLSIGVGILGCLIGMFPLAIGGVVFEITATPEDYEYVDLERTNLIALKDNFQVEGTSFLFSSITDEELKYTYIYEEPNCGMTTNTIKASKVYIKYIDENETPYIQKWKKLPKSNIIDWLFLVGETKYTIYLPQGSVIENEYQIDLE